MSTNFHQNIYYGSQILQLTFEIYFRSLEPEAAPTENFTEPEAMMLENINEFNNQLSHWRQRLTIPNTDQIQVIRDRLDQTVSMVGYSF